MTTLKKPATAPLLFLPGGDRCHGLMLTNHNGAFKLARDPVPGRVAWQIRTEAK